MAKKASAAEEMSDFNLKKLNTQEYLDHLKASIELSSVGCLTNVAIFGLRGSGKTICAKQAISESGHQELYVNLSVVDLRESLLVSSFRHSLKHWCMPVERSVRMVPRLKP
jgi:predicted AAA+ superfamily ATPase